MITLQSFQTRMAQGLHKIEAAIVGLWQKSEITEFRNDSRSSVVLMTHRYYWKTLPNEHRAEQARLIGQYKRWFELFLLCHAQHSEDVHREIKEINDYVSSAIQLNTSWNTESTIEKNQTYLAERLAGFHALLSAPQTEMILVPDTNALLRASDPADYKAAIESEVFTFALVPTVLAELDDLKRSRRDQTLGEKAEKVIRRIKGFRVQGSVLEGVTVAKTITVKMIATEPRMADAPAWLDVLSKDDRIVASVLEIQFGNPSATVLLVTGDINLQNKAEMAFLPWAEPPASSAKSDSI